MYILRDDPFVDKEVIVKDEEEDTVDVDFPASMSVNNDAIFAEAQACSSLGNSPVKAAATAAGGAPIHGGGRGLSFGLEASTNCSETRAKVSPVKVSLFKKRPPKPLKGASRKKSKKEHNIYTLTSVIVTYYNSFEALIKSTIYSLSM